LNVLDKKEIQIAHPAVAKLVDGSIILPKDVCLVSSPKSIVHWQDADAPDGGADDQCPGCSNQALAELASLVSSNEAGKAGCANKEEPDVNIKNDTYVVREQDAIICDGEQKPEQETHPDAGAPALKGQWTEERKQSKCHLQAQVCRYPSNPIRRRDDGRNDNDAPENENH